MRAAPRLISALVLGPQHRPTNVETSGHALRRTTEDENWGGAQTGGPRIQGYPGGRSLSGRIFEGVSARHARVRAPRFTPARAGGFRPCRRPFGRRVSNPPEEFAWSSAIQPKRADPTCCLEGLI